MTSSVLSAAPTREVPDLTANDGRAATAALDRATLVLGSSTGVQSYVAFCLIVRQIWAGPGRRGA